MKEKTFRADLFYRLNVIRLYLPPLKDRKVDIPLLIDHFMKRLLALRETRARKISKECMAVLLNYDYPGNIRELENILEHALLICQDSIVEPHHLPLSLKVELQRPSVPKEESAKPLTAARQESEKERIHDVLRRHNWNRGRSARELNIDRTTLWRKMRKYNLAP